MKIRHATINDVNRIAEIEVFNYRINFFPIFKNDEFYFNNLQVINMYSIIKEHLSKFYVYDDGVVKGFIKVESDQLKKLFVEPILQNNKIGTKLLQYAVNNLNVKYLWTLEKNTKAINFYLRNNFKLTNELKLEEGTNEYLVKLIY